MEIAVIGLGTMGSGMARNLLKAGYTVVAFNRTRAKAESLAAAGARTADSPALAAQNADLIISMVADDDASRETWLGQNGALASARSGALLIESSTVTPAWIEELGNEARKRNLQLMDAPVTGSRIQADEGALNFIVGGDTAALEQARPILKAMSKTIVHAGPLGSGARLKLINNFLCGVQVASLAEALSWIERSGLDREQALDFLKKGAPGSPLLGAISARMVEAKYDVNFLLPLMKKDLDYSERDAKEYKLDLSMGHAAAQRFAAALSAGLDDKDMSAVIEPLRHQQLNKQSV